MHSRYFYLLLLASLLSACLTSKRENAEPIHLVIAAGVSSKEVDLTAVSVRRYMKQNPGIGVHLGPTPNTYLGRLARYREWLQEKGSAVDVIQVDLTWLQELAPYAFDLEEFVPADELEQHFKLFQDYSRVDGKLVGLPWSADAPFLYYRSDLLEKYGYQNPPKTWNELEEMAFTIQTGERRQGNTGFWGYVWQGAASEGLTCNALEWQMSEGGGNLLNPQGRPAFDSEPTVLALTRAARWIGRISPPQVLEWDEDQSRIAWQQGTAAFMRNWSYAYRLSEDKPELSGRFGVTRMPAGAEGSVAVLGGRLLMVSRNSKHPQEATHLVRFLTSAEEQKARAVGGGFMPTIPALYKAEVVEANPFLQDFDTVIKELLIRPFQRAAGEYVALSTAYWTGVESILKGANPRQALMESRLHIERILDSDSSQSPH